MTSRSTDSRISLTVLLKTTESAAFSANPAPANSSIVVSGRFAPAAARVVEILTADMRYGIPTGWSLTSNPDGRSRQTFPREGTGKYKFRVVVPATSTEAEASIRLPTLHVG